ncbi:MAG TPA: hypothetical protein VGO16_04110 [Pseudonocardiaceae bacterium]|nr:hypothetical protein [Pseudonocardiaceae bacterium]
MHVLDQAGVITVVFGANEIESPSANEPIRALRARVDEVMSNLDRHVPSALVLDDADLLLGRFALTQYTHNLQRVTAELMRIAGAVNLESQGGALAAPIFMLGNRRDLFHEPLLRPGRARLFIWVPERDEVQLVLERVFHESTPHDIASLIEKFRGQQLSFFAALRDALLDEFLLHN